MSRETLLPGRPEHRRGERCPSREVSRLAPWASRGLPQSSKHLAAEKGKGGGCVGGKGQGSEVCFSIFPVSHRMSLGLHCSLTSSPPLGLHSPAREAKAAQGRWAFSLWRAPSHFMEDSEYNSFLFWFCHLFWMTTSTISCCQLNPNASIPSAKTGHLTPVLTAFAPSGRPCQVWRTEYKLTILNWEGVASGLRLEKNLCL